MHPVILAYCRWRELYQLVTFGGRDDLQAARYDAWRFLQELRGVYYDAEGNQISGVSIDRGW